MNRFCLLAAALSCGVAFSAAAMTREEYRVQRIRIQDQYATAKDRCTTVAAPQRDVCETQARVAYNIARTQLRAEFRPSDATLAKARRTKAEGAYEVAKAKCGDLKAGARKVCLDEARSHWVEARGQ